METVGSDKADGRHTEWIVRLTRGFERWVIVILIVMMIGVVAISVVDLGWTIVRRLLEAPMILAGDELLETIRAPLKTNVVQVEIVLEVALIAVARKLIVLPMDKYSPAMLLGMAVLVVAIAVGHILQRHARLRAEKEEGEDRQASAG